MKNIFKIRGIIAFELMAVAAGISVITAVAFPVFAKAREKARQTICVSNQRQIAIAVLMYAQDNKECLPKSSHIWTDINVNIDPEVLKCQTDKENDNGYVYNNKLSGVALGYISDPSAAFLTADGKTVKSKNRTLDNIYYSPADIQYRHITKAVESFVDGHVEMVEKITEPESWDKTR
jgi:type II secretory pathway pseudopilin PulG